MFANNTVGDWAAWTFSIAAVTTLLGAFCFVGKAVERRRGQSAMFNYDLWKLWVPFGSAVTVVLLLVTIALWAA
jgi:hypothetical protein